MSTSIGSDLSGDLADAYEDHRYERMELANAEDESNLCVNHSPYDDTETMEQTSTRSFSAEPHSISPTSVCPISTAHFYCEKPAVPFLVHTERRLPFEHFVSDVQNIYASERIEI